MKKPVNPAVAVVLVIVVVAVAVMLGWKSLGPRTDGPEKPVDMSKMMNQMAPPSKGGMGGPGGAPGGR